MKLTWPDWGWMDRLWPEWRRPEYLFREALAASVGLHLLLLVSGNISFQWARLHPVEIDITDMGPRRTASAPQKPASKPKEWVKSTAQAPIPAQPAAPPEEIPLGTGEGGEGKVTNYPQLLNLSELGVIMARLYPQKAREEGREAVVVLDIHLDAEGHINGVEVVQSSDPEFDDAAVRVSHLLRFRPAYVQGQAVAVKMRQPLRFKLLER